MKNAFPILGVFLTEDAKIKLAKTKEELCAPSSPKTVIFTPNSLILFKASKSSADRHILNSATILLPDGAGVVLASRLLGYPIKERLSGIDTAEDILSFAEKRSLSVFLLGGKTGISNAAAQRLRLRFPKLHIVGTHHGYFVKNGEENKKVIEKINNASPDILFVCFGYPTQERWIYENKEKLSSVKLFMGLGGSLDVWSGRTKRAPVLMQKMNLEWLWRLLLEPRRSKDICSLPLFFLKVVLYRDV